MPRPLWVLDISIGDDLLQLLEAVAQEIDLPPELEILDVCNRG